MTTILLTALLSSIFTGAVFLWIFQRYIQPYFDAQIAYIQQQADTLIQQSSPQISADIADAIEAKFNLLKPEIEAEFQLELETIINKAIPVLASEVEQGVDNSFKKFIPTLVGSAATLPAETILKTSSTILNTGLGILRSASEPKK